MTTKLPASTFLATLLLSTPVFAQGAAAEALYQQGQAALKAGDLDTACARFRASDKLDPAVGTELDLGYCEEKRGRLASAWEALHAALGKYPEGDARAKTLEKRIKKLEARLPQLVLALAPGAPRETTVREGDAIVGSAATYGAPIPFDPGEHHLTVTAPGRAARTVDVTLTEGKTSTVSVEPGAAEEKAVEKPPEKVPPPPPPTPPPAPAAGPGPGPWVVGGVGVAGLVVGAVTGALVLVGRSKVSANCNDATATCVSPDGITAANTVRTLGPVTTVSLVVGGAALAAGGIWLGVSQSSQASARVHLAPTIGGAAGRVEVSW